MAQTRHGAPALTELGGVFVGGCSAGAKRAEKNHLSQAQPAGAMIRRRRAKRV